MCKVVHWQKDAYDVYIGRLQGGAYNKWAYPKELRETFPEGTPRQVIIDAYEDYLRSQPVLMQALPELMYQTLGCWCKPKACHGDILKKYVDRLEAQAERSRLFEA